MATPLLHPRHDLEHHPYGTLVYPRLTALPHAAPRTSQCVQSDTPHPSKAHCSSLASCPEHVTLSISTSPVPMPKRAVG